MIALVAAAAFGEPAEDYLGALAFDEPQSDDFDDFDESDDVLSPFGAEEPPVWFESAIVAIACLTRPRHCRLLRALVRSSRRWPS